MLMLLRNDLLHYTHPSPRTVRILWIAPEQSHAYVFDVSARSADVELVRLDALLADLRAGHASVLSHDPYLLVVSQELLPPKHLQLRARAWEIIEPLTAMEPGIYEARVRGQMIAQATAAHGVSHPTIYRYLRRYWQRGQTPNALLPDYSNSGARGKVRAASAGVKRGRPRKDGADPGLNADEGIRRIFRVATALYAASHDKFSRLRAYQQMLTDFFDGRSIDPVSGRVLAAATAPRAPLPTFGQFSYWLEQDDDRPPEVLRRRGARPAPAASLPQAGLPVPPASQALAPGRPGASFYLDAVCADVQLVSRADRKQSIGRPQIYMAVDSFSRMVTGVYVGMGPASWQQAMLALANCGADKGRYCGQFGRDIEAAQWPCRHLPETLFTQAALVDGWSGGWGGDALLNNFNLRCVSVEQGPDDWKAVLEKRFGLLPASTTNMQANLPAGVPAGVPTASSALDGVLDLRQFTRIVIDCILYYNNSLAGGSTSPRQLWDQGVAQRGGGLKTYPEHLIRCSLLPVAQATVTADGIHLFDSSYTCARAINERWYDRVRLRGQWNVKVAYDPANLDMIYLLDPAAPMQFHACHMNDDMGEVRQLSAVELSCQRRALAAEVQTAAQLGAAVDAVRLPAGALESQRSAPVYASFVS
jgi:hypothetical protein